MKIGKDNLIIDEKKIAHGKAVSLKCNKSKDRVVVTHYQKHNKVVMQGRPEVLFSTIIGYITELIEVEEIPKIFNDTYNLNIDKDEVRSEFQFICQMLMISYRLRKWKDLFIRLCII